MGAYMLIFVLTLVGGIGTICRKNYAKDNINVKHALNLYMLIAHPLAAVYFLIMAGGQVPLNMTSFWFSFVYAWICMASMLFTMLAYDRINLIYISVFSGAGAMVVPFAYDLICGVRFSVYNYIAVALRIAAVLVPLAFNKTKNRGLIICIILFFVSGAAGIIPKIYGAWQGVVSDESFCFWTNIVILPIVVVLILSQLKNGKKTNEDAHQATGRFRELWDDTKKIKVSGYIYIMIATLTANIGSLASIGIMRMVSPTVYAILSSSMGLFVTAAISRFIYKEEIKKKEIISLALSVGAVVLGVF